MIPTTLVKAVDLHLVDGAGGRGHAQPDRVVFGDDSRLTDLRISVPIIKHVHVKTRDTPNQITIHLLCVNYTHIMNANMFFFRHKLVLHIFVHTQCM